MSVRPAKTQISLGIRPVWSESSLCAQWISKDPRFFMQTAKALIRLGGCPGWSESSLGAHCWFCLVVAYLTINSITASLSTLQYRVITDSVRLIKFKWLHYKNLSWVWGADRKIRPRSLFGTTELCRVMPNTDPEGRIFLSAPNNHDRVFLLHIFRAPAFVGVAIIESRSNTLTSAILKLNVVYNVTMTSIPTSSRQSYVTSYATNILTTRVLIRFLSIPRVE